jgi:hypothetical protein
MKKTLLILLVSFSLFASDMKMQSRDLSPKDMKSQNKEIVKLVAQEMTESLPQKIDKYTTLLNITADGSTLVYNF